MAASAAVPLMARAETIDRELSKESGGEFVQVSFDSEARNEGVFDLSATPVFCVLVQR